MISKILTKITDYLVGVQTKANRAANQQAAITAPTGEALRRFMPEIMGEAILRDQALATGIRVIADAVAGLPVDIMRVEIEDGKRVLIDDNDHEANELIKFPNPNQDFPTITTHMVEALLAQGNSFHGIEMENSRTPNELWPLPVDKMIIKVNRSSGDLMGYEFDNRGTKGKAFYEPEEMLHVMLYNINDQWWGRSRTEPIERQIKGNFWMHRENESFFRGGARYDTVFTPEESMNTQQIEQFKQAVREKRSEDQVAHGMFIAPVSGKLDALQASMKEMEFIAGQKLNRENIYAMLGIPPVLGGVLEGVNFATAKIQEASFWRHTMKPLLRIIESAFTRQVIWRHFDEDHVLQFDLSGVEALQLDRLEQARSNAILVNADIKTRDEVRSDEFDLEPHIDGRGEEPLFVAGSGSDPAVSQNPKGIQPEIKKKSAAEIAWREFDIKATKVERHLKSIIANYFIGQRKRLLDKLDENTKGGHILLPLLVARLKQDPVDPEDVLDLLDIEEENRILRELFGPLFASATQRAGQAVLDDFNISLSFNIQEPEVKAFIQELVNNITTINKTAFKQVRSIIESALDEGVGVQELTRRLKTQYRHLTTSQARTIARTESVKIINGAGQQAAMQSDVLTHQQWQPTLDDRTRETHIRTFGNGGYHGEIRRIGEAFTGGGDPLRYPGDGPAHQAINCRCALLYIAHEDPTADLNAKSIDDFIKIG